MQSEFREVRAIPPGTLGEWLRARFPGRASPQWWQALFESVESAVSPLRNVDHRQRISDLKLGASAAILAVERQDVDASLGAYWLLRFAVAALRLGIQGHELPVVLTPDGAAAWALERLSVSKDAAVELARMRRERHLAADESFFAPVGATYECAGQEPDRESRTLGEVERILSALPWVADRVEDPAIRREVEAWLAIEERL